MVMKKILIALALLLTGIASGSACTGISFLAEDGGYVQARTIEWGNSYLPSEYVIVPRGQDLVSYTPTGVNGLRFRAKYGLVGLAIIQKEFVAEGLNEVGLSAGLFYFPHYGKYEEYDEAQNAITLSDLHRRGRRLRLGFAGLCLVHRAVAVERVRRAVRRVRRVLDVHRHADVHQPLVR